MRDYRAEIEAEAQAAQEALDQGTLDEAQACVLRAIAIAQVWAADD